VYETSSRLSVRRVKSRSKIPDPLPSKMILAIGVWGDVGRLALPLIVTCPIAPVIPAEIEVLDDPGNLMVSKERLSAVYVNSMFQDPVPDKAVGENILIRNCSLTISCVNVMFCICFP